MSAIKELNTPVTLVFSPVGKLVSFSGNNNGFFLSGMDFNSLLGESDDLFSEILSDRNNCRGNVLFRKTGQYFSCASHGMKDQNGNILALIVTLFLNSGIDERIIRMDKLAQLGQFAASIAHEIRNPLAGINANAQVLAEILPPDKSTDSVINIILEETQRMEKIIKDLLNYARQTKPCFEPVNIFDVTKYVETLVSAQLRKNKIVMKIFLDRNSEKIMADFSKLVQVMVNLIMNSMQAMPDGGEIEVSSKKLKEENELQITVRDTGSGMSIDNLERIFEPFYTTRSKGLGLGLCVVKSIVMDLSGRVAVYSEKEKGTSAVLNFPIISGSK